MADTDGAPVLNAELSVEHGQVEFGGVAALVDVDFAVPRHGVVGVVGPNGAGKSTLLGVLGGQLRLTSGRVTLGGQDITKWAPHRRAKSGVIRTFQLSSQFDRLTVAENFLLGVKRHRGEGLAGCSRRLWRSAEAEYLEKAMEMMARLELRDKADRLAGTLSGGQRRLLEIGRALMNEPSVLLFDEPVAGVSLSLIPRVQEVIAAAADTGVGIVVVEHDLSVVESVCDSVVVMSRGAILKTGPLHEVLRDAAVIDAYLVG